MTASELVRRPHANGLGVFDRDSVEGLANNARSAAGAAAGVVIAGSQEVAALVHYALSMYFGEESTVRRPSAARRAGAVEVKQVVSLVRYQAHLRGERNVAASFDLARRNRMLA